MGIGFLDNRNYSYGPPSYKKQIQSTIYLNHITRPTQQDKSPKHKQEKEYKNKKQQSKTSKQCG